MAVHATPSDTLRGLLPSVRLAPLAYATSGRHRALDDSLERTAELYGVGRYIRTAGE